jgi:hypothetical protein
VCELEATGAPSIFNVIRSAAALARMLPTLYLKRLRHFLLRLFFLFLKKKKHAQPSREMSFGKLNILKHKSWNVWNRDNIEKVLRDERLNREEEQKKRKRVDETESESRTQVLRAKRARDLSQDRNAGAAGGGKEGKDCAFLSLADKFVAPDSVPRIEGGGMPLSITTQGKGERGTEGEGDGAQVVVHKGFSIFAGMEHELAAAAENTTAQGVQNKEAVEEKRKEKEKFDRQWGLVGLGQDAITGTMSRALSHSLCPSIKYDKYHDLTGQMASCRPWYATAQSASAPTFDGLGQVCLCLCACAHLHACKYTFLHACKYT